MEQLAKQLSDFLNSPDWTVDEKWIIKWQFNHVFGFLGHFHTALFEAICRADEDNLAKLALGFPEEVRGFIKWSQGSLGKRLREAGLDI